MSEGTLLLEASPYLWEGKSNYLWILDAGHGGMKDGKYTTAPAKMHTFPDGLTIYEGVINRAITNLVAAALLSKGIDYAVVSAMEEDIRLEERVRKADAIYAKDKRAVFISIHSNAGGGKGLEIFTSPGQTKSDIIAEFFCANAIEAFPQFPFRADHADGDADKEADFYVLRKTDCPAVLLENLFFDNRQEADFLLSSAGQKAIAKWIFDTIIELEEKQPI